MRSSFILLLACLVPRPTQAIFEGFPVISFGDEGFLSFLFSGCWLVLPVGISFFLSDFRYDQLVSERGLMQLAQAGIYEGAADIQEYGSFLTSESPFLKEVAQSNFEIRYRGLADDGQCMFNVGVDWYHLHDEATSAYEAEYDYPIMFKAFLPRGRKASRINVYFADGFFDIVFSKILDSGNTRQAVCDIYSNQCSSFLTETDIDCLGSIETLDVTEGPDNLLDGKTQACRALHGAFALQNPTQHCPHISFSAQADPTGSVKCQTTLGISPDTLFDDKDFAFWEEYCEKHGFKPEIGLREIL